LKQSGAANWWLRSPNASNANNARYLNNEGYSNENNVENANAGVRADIPQIVRMLS